MTGDKGTSIRGMVLAALSARPGEYMSSREVCEAIGKSTRNGSVREALHDLQRAGLLRRQDPSPGRTAWGVTAKPWMPLQAAMDAIARGQNGAALPRQG